MTRFTFMGIRQAVCKSSSTVTPLACTLDLLRYMCNTTITDLKKKARLARSIGAPLIHSAPSFPAFPRKCAFKSYTGSALRLPSRACRISSCHMKGEGPMEAHSKSPRT